MSYLSKIIKESIAFQIYNTNLDKKTKHKYIDFILNKCSDHEIFYALQHNEFPEHKPETESAASDIAKYLAKQTAKKGYKVGKTAVISGIVLAGIIIYSSYKTYKRYLSKAGKACKGSGIGMSRTRCLMMYKIYALKKRIEELKKSINLCHKSKHYEKCKSKIEKEISKIQTRIDKLEGRFKK